MSASSPTGEGLLPIQTPDGGRDARPTPGALGVEIVGIQNLLFIAVILLGVFQPGFVDVLTRIKAEGASVALLGRLVVCREALMVLAAAGSLLATPKALHQRNGFTFGPIREVAILFIGIFSTMIPALQWLEANAQRMPLKTPGQFYFTTGTLSAVLDNAPTYLAFLTARLGELDRTEVDLAAADLDAMSRTGQLEVEAARQGTRVGRAEEQVLRTDPQRVRDGRVTRGQIEIAFLLGNPELHAFIVAISLGAVFFGAGTYIGNGPNFMVKAVAHAAGAPTPTFTGYIFRYALPILAPVYLLVWALFFLRG
jgi:Na+/H+ antiporter NhaD/arsenite permease-like protein